MADWPAEVRSARTALAARPQPAEWYSRALHDASGAVLTERRLASLFRAPGGELR